MEEKAIAQTKMLKGLLERADRVWISPTLRTRQTSEILSLQGEPDTALRDCDYGRWSGKAIGDLHVIEPENVAVWLADMTAAPHGGESLAALSERVAVWVDHRLGERGHTIAITHASVIRAALLHVLQAPPSAFWKIDAEPLSVVQMSGDGRRWTLRFSNQTRSII